MRYSLSVLFLLLYSGDAKLHMIHCAPVQTDSNDNAHVPYGMRAAAKPIKPMRFTRLREHALGEVSRVEDEPGDIREKRGHDGG